MVQPSKKFDAFVSYGEDDREDAERIARHLRSAGLSVWFYPWQVTAGDDVFRAIEEGLQDSNNFIFCVSERAFNGRWADLERSTAASRSVNDPSCKIIPIILEPCTMPDTLRRLQAMDWTDRDDATLDQLVDTLQSQRDPQGSPRLDGGPPRGRVPSQREGTGGTPRMPEGAVARLELISGPQRGAYVFLEPDEELVVGKDPNCDLPIDDARLSRRHASLSHRGGLLWLSDLSSTNGTFIGRRWEHRLTRRVALIDGDRVAMGGTKILVSIPDCQLDPSVLAQYYEDSSVDFTSEPRQESRAYLARWNQAWQIGRILMDPRVLFACPFLDRLSLGSVDERDLEVVTKLELSQLLIHSSLPNAGSLVSIVRMSSLRHLSLSCHGLSDDDLKPLSGLHQVRKLELVDVGGPMLRHLKGLNGLKELRLEGSAITSGDLEHIGGIPNLTTLDTRPPLALDDESLAYLEPLGSLEKLPPLDPDRVTDVGVRSISHLRSLVKLDLSGSRITDEGVGELVGLRHLSSLDLSETSIGDAALPSIGRLQRLRVLDLRETSISEAGLEHLTGLGNIRELGLSISVGDVGLESIGELTNLSRLPPLDTSRITLRGVVNILRLTGLSSLDLGGARIVGDDEVLRVSELVGLTELDLSDTAVTDYGIGVIAATLPHLDRLVMSGCSIGDAALAALGRMNGCLETLDIGHTEVTDAAAPSLCRIGATKLSLAGTRIGDRTIQALAEDYPTGRMIRRLDVTDTVISGHSWGALRKLSSTLDELVLGGTTVSDAVVAMLVESYTLRELGLSRTDISDASLKDLATLPSLKTLDLSHTEISDRGLRALAESRSLRQVDLRGTRVTKEGLRKLLGSARKGPELEVRSDLDE